MDSETHEIVLSLIDEPKNAMRSDMDRDEIFELSLDIKKNGLINPITVRPRGDRFEVVAGHRRFLAHRFGGMVTIRCVVRDLNDDEAFAVMTSENLVREDVNPVDEASHVSRLLSLHNGDVMKVAEIVNRSRGWVEDRVLIGEMPERLKQLLREGKMRIGVALALSEIDDESDLNVCIDTALSQGASLVVAQYFVAQWRAGLFGNKYAVKVPDLNAPLGYRKVIMLRCAVDGKEYPATSFVSLLVCRDNMGYVESLREHLSLEAQKNTSSGGENGNAARPSGSDGRVPSGESPQGDREPSGSEAGGEPVGE